MSLMLSLLGLRCSTLVHHLSTYTDILLMLAVFDLHPSAYYPVIEATSKASWLIGVAQLLIEEHAICLIPWVFHLSVDHHLLTGDAWTASCELLHILRLLTSEELLVVMWGHILELPTRREARAHLSRRAGPLKLSSRALLTQSLARILTPWLLRPGVRMTKSLLALSSFLATLSQSVYLLLYWIRQVLAILA